MELPAATENSAALSDSLPEVTAQNEKETQGGEVTESATTGEASTEPEEAGMNGAKMEGQEESGEDEQEGPKGPLAMIKKGAVAAVGGTMVSAKKVNCATNYCFTNHLT